MLHAEMWQGRLTEVRKSARGTLRYARGIQVYGVAGLETFFFKVRSLFVNFHKTKKLYNQINKNYTINQNKK